MANVALRQQSRRALAPLCFALAAVVPPALAQLLEPAILVEEVVITALRRAQPVHEAPAGILVHDGESIAARRLLGLADLGRTSPGFFVLDQHRRAESPIVARGLNLEPLAAAGSLPERSGSTVARYVGEVPVGIDLRLEDLERVELLLGPQGVHYGAGALGGVVRYLPRRPELDSTTITLRGGAFQTSAAEGVGADGGFTLNLPFSDSLGVRAVLDYLDDPGFVDYDYLLREPGVSNPEPDLSDGAARAANLRQDEDADYRELLSARLGVRWRPSERLDAHLTYYHQEQEIGGRTVSHREAFRTARYVAAHRFPEPHRVRQELTALELTADLGFAALTAATGSGSLRERGQRDATDWLIALERGYERVPRLAAVGFDERRESRFSQELRLASGSDRSLDWLAGLVYGTEDARAANEVRLPAPASGPAVPGASSGALAWSLRTRENLEQRAAFAEIGARPVADLRLGIGARWHYYEIDGWHLESGGMRQRRRRSGDGTALRLDASYSLSEELHLYAARSEGYRVGGLNGAVLCPTTSPGEGCARPAESTYGADRAVSHEIGLRGEWLDRRLRLYASLYAIDWRGPQRAGVTASGLLPVTINGEGARSRGLELSLGLRPNDRFTLQAGLALNDAELSAGAAGLLETIVPPGFSGKRVVLDGQEGDRLPGAPRHQANAFLSYEIPYASERRLHLDYGLAWTGAILTRAGTRADGERLGGFAVHDVAARLTSPRWTATFYIENLFDRYAVTGAEATAVWAQTLQDANGAPFRTRGYYKDVLRPREIGLRFTYDLGLL